jgi:hypothetical protein
MNYGLIQEINSVPAFNNEIVWIQFEFIDIRLSTAVKFFVYFKIQKHSYEAYEKLKDANNEKYLKEIFPNFFPKETKEKSIIKDKQEKLI